MNLLKRIYRSLRLPDGMLSRTSQVLITGQNQLLVSGHRGMIEAQPHRFGFVCIGFRLWITGTDLSADAATATEALVSGKISSVEFEHVKGENT